ncbi:MAG: PepSY domain-containing protein [Alysiella sp.]|uniref:PepSY domain-containing protein n=1 Tax=Alysiella sp. TaxID=1872483 RepID=UPI0026DCEB76|nr:PepSY domain-containing protein [Alysiella sp.]MDO4433793.1 PepSY domain-containing protein [Alysiella sp.]
MKKIQSILMVSMLLGTISVPAMADNDERIYRENRNQYITHDKAREIAIESVGGGYVKHDDVDFEYNRQYGAHFEVEVHGQDGREYEIKIDAKTGKVLYKHQDQ